MDRAITLHEVRKSFGEHRAVDGLSLEVPQGTVFGLLGRNGAGKSTAIRCLLGFQAPTRGRTRVFGCDSLELRMGVRR